MQIKPVNFVKLTTFAATKYKLLNLYGVTTNLITYETQFWCRTWHLTS